MSAVVPAEQIMIIGAQCRDLLNWRLGDGPPLRSTNDTDVAIAIQDWQVFENIRDRFPPLGDTGHRFLIGSVATDVIPFGDVEEPPGLSSHPPGHQVMNVHGFLDSFQRADELPLSSGICIKIPRAEGYAALKTHAWLDRSQNYEYRDGPDLALAAYWYVSDLDLLYRDTHQWALERHDHDHYGAAAALLGAAMRDGLSSEECGVLSRRVEVADRDLLAHHFGVGKPGWPDADSTRRPIVDALFEQLIDD
ncbi:hypothetical protein [Mycolicibacter kumamotonensis]|uniref:hypothetical protein n=1 Tax=Mycolicibacter kumamotonensis TaxID=354243 RepID=UPI001F21F048|nr:hypothetical protein [Mycolicibacter kumamotonensis]